MVEVKVRRKVLDGLEVSIVPEDVPAFIATVHLSDHVTNCLPLWMALEEGDTICNLKCLSKTKKKGIVSSHSHSCLLLSVKITIKALSGKSRPILYIYIYIYIYSALYNTDAVKAALQYYSGK